MRIRLRQALVALTLSGVLVGGGTALAHAATAKATPTAKSSSSASSHSSSGSSSHARTNGKCPNM